MTGHVKDQLCQRIEELEKEKLELNEQLDALQKERDALAAPAVQGEPSLVVWVLYDAISDQKHMKMRIDGSLAIFDSEAAARRAKFLHPGTDYKRCEYYDAPQPTYDVSGLVEALEQERDALTAHVERLEDIIERSTLADSPAAESALEETPDTSLARRDTEEPARHVWGGEGDRCVKCGDKDWMADSVCSESKLRRQAEGGET